MPVFRLHGILELQQRSLASPGGRGCFMQRWWTAVPLRQKLNKEQSMKQHSYVYMVRGRRIEVPVMAPAQMEEYSRLLREFLYDEATEYLKPIGVKVVGQ